MTVFLDTSALIKLYHDERFSIELVDYLRSARITAIADLAVPEVVSAAWRKVRSPQFSNFSEEDGIALQEAFEKDLGQYLITPIRGSDWSAARDLINRCSYAGFALRTLDALHLQCALKISALLDEFITFDGDLKSAARFCGLRVPDL